MQNPTLPLELIREILLRLPVRSILRFKCVCKSWLSLISDSQFSISHFDLAAAPTHRLFLIANDYYGESIDTDAPLLMGALRFILPPTSSPWRDEYGDDYLDKHEILGSCRGLMLLYYDRSSDLILWNPSNGAHKLYPKIDFGLTIINLFGFGYDSSTDDYLLILVGLSESKYYESGYENDVSEDDNDAVYRAHYNVFSFKTDSWDMKDDFVTYKDLGDRFRTGLLFNEALHWLVFSKDKKVPVIIAFDVIQRSLSEIPLFDYFTMKEYKVCSLRVIGGCLSVFCSVQGCAKGEIWVMKEYKVASSWTKSIVVTTNGFSPICIAKDGGIIGSNISGRLEKLNDKGELLEHLIYGEGQWQCYGNLQFAVYRESLLSIPTVVKKTIEFDLWGISEDDHGEASEDDHREIGEDDLGETSEDEQQ